jgi:hypothetical protein
VTGLWQAQLLEVLQQLVALVRVTVGWSPVICQQMVADLWWLQWMATQQWWEHSLLLAVQQLLATDAMLIILQL